MILKDSFKSVSVETDDSLDSINATAIVKYVPQKAGIGIGAGSILPGPLSPWWVMLHIQALSPAKPFLSAVKSSASRCTVERLHCIILFGIWKLKIYLFQRITKVQKITECASMDYGVLFNKLMYERPTYWRRYYTISPNDVPWII